jgi:hypothetical protein
MRNTIDASGASLDPVALRQPSQDGIRETGSTRLLCREQSVALRRKRY